MITVDVGLSSATTLRWGVKRRGLSLRIGILGGLIGFLSMAVNFRSEGELPDRSPTDRPTGDTDDQYYDNTYKISCDTTSTIRCRINRTETGSISRPSKRLVDWCSGFTFPCFNGKMFLSSSIPLWLQNWRRFCSLFCLRRLEKTPTKRLYIGKITFPFAVYYDCYGSGKHYPFLRADERVRLLYKHVQCRSQKCPRYFVALNVGATILFGGEERRKLDKNLSPLSIFLFLTLTLCKNPNFFLFSPQTLLPGVTASIPMHILNFRHRLHSRCEEAINSSL